MKGGLILEALASLCTLDDFEMQAHRVTNRDGHHARDLVLFAADGKILSDPFPHGWRPVNWSGMGTRDLMSGDATKLGRFDGQSVVPFDEAPRDTGTSGCRMIADILGDFRDEIICSGETSAGAPALLVYSNTRPIQRREVTRTSSREYRLWMPHNMGGGYASYFEWEQAQ